MVLRAFCITGVIPAKAGIQLLAGAGVVAKLDPRLRGDDGRGGERVSA